MEKSTTLEQKVNTDEMQYALTAIAQEMQRFQSATTFNSNASRNPQLDETSKEFQILTSKLRLKKLQIKKLKESLKTACTIAKTVIRAKETETTYLNNQINAAREEYTNIIKKNEECTIAIRKLTTVNQVLNEKLNNIHNFIDLGYQELQIIRNGNLENVSIVMKLKQILLYCGQYYADYCNEHENCLQLERKNRFLNNKLKILDTHLKAATEERLRNLQHQKISKAIVSTNDRKLKTENQKYKVDGNLWPNALSEPGLDSVFGHTKYYSKQAVDTVEFEEENKKHTDVPGIDNFDLSSHFSLVKNLLCDQDIMLRDLKKLSEEITLQKTSLN